MTEATRQGGCQCGAVRYSCPAKPRALYVCHCRECQRQSSSAFGMSYIVEHDRLVHVSGATKSFVRDTDTGASIECVFCPACGSRLWHRLARYPQNVSVKGGTLDEPPSLADAVHIWTKRKLDAVTIPVDAKSYPGEPPD